MTTAFLRYGILSAIATIPGLSLVAADRDVQVHGFASQGYLYTAGNNWNGRTTGGGTFELNEFGLNISAMPIDRLRIGVQVFARDLANYGNDQPAIDWAFGQYDLPAILPNMDLRFTVGRFKPGQGFYNDYRDLDMTRPQVFLPFVVYDPNLRDAYIAINGAAVGGRISSDHLGALDGQAFVGTQTIDASPQTPFGDRYKVVGPVTDGVWSNVNVRYLAGGNLTWETPIDGLRLKGSYEHVQDYVLTGTSPTFGAIRLETPSYDQIICGAEYQQGDLTLATEYVNDHYIRVSKIGNTAATGSWLLRQGGYVSAAYRFARRWEGYLAYNGLVSSSSTPVTPAQGNIQSTEHRAVAAALCVNVNEHWLVKAEFQRIRGNNYIYPFYNPDGQELYWNLFAFKTTLDF